MSQVNLPIVSTPPKLYIQLTEGEWERVDEKVRQMGKSDVHSYLRCKLSTLARLYNVCPPCVTNASGEIKKVRHHIPKDILPVLEQISLITQKPISTIVTQ